MKKIILLNPAISSLNVGDSIISQSAKEQLNFILKDAFSIDVSTHLPISWYYMRHTKSFDYRFVLGSNLLKATCLGLKRQWDITIKKSKLISPCILVGAGWWQYNNKMNLYTKILLKKVLSKDYIHSVRDEYTERMLRSIGINNVINTSCPTMWSLTKEHCSEIPHTKSSKVIFTLTDYAEEKKIDKQFIEILKQNYKEIYFWPQGAEDVEYLNKLEIDISGIKIIPPTLKEYDNKLLQEDIDYIGTRLHGGIRALQKKRRTIIIAIDNRAIEKNKNFNIPIIKRENIEELNEMINMPFETQITIPEEKIRRWKEQFKNKE